MGAELGTYLPDEVVRERAHQEAEQGIPDPRLYGDNREPALQHEVAKAAEVGQAAQGAKLLIDIQPVTDELEESRPQVADLEDRAGLTLDTWQHALDVVLKL